MPWFSNASRSARMFAAMMPRPSRSKCWMVDSDTLAWPASVFWDQSSRARAARHWGGVMLRAYNVRDNRSLAGLPVTLRKNSNLSLMKAYEYTPIGLRSQNPRVNPIGFTHRNVFKRNSTGFAITLILFGLNVRTFEHIVATNCSLVEGARGNTALKFANSNSKFINDGASRREVSSRRGEVICLNLLHSNLGR